MVQQNPSLIKRPVQFIPRQNFPPRKPVMPQSEPFGKVPKPNPAIKFPGKPPITPRPNAFLGIPPKKSEKPKKLIYITIGVFVLLVALIIFLITRSGEDGEDLIPECIEDFECANGEVCDNGFCVSSTLVECDEGDFRECGSDIGECSLGAESCVNGQWNDVCENEILPATEICDQKDNDCDVFVDEENVCDTGTGNGGGNFYECVNDSDCINNENCINGFCVSDVGDLSCLPGQTRFCGNNIGECKQGNQTCANETWSSCVGAISAVSEICDGKDNDCDNSADEGGICPIAVCGNGICENTESQSSQSEGVSLCLADCLKQTNSCNELYNISDLDGSHKKNYVWGVYKNGTSFNISTFCIGESNKIGQFIYSVRRYNCGNHGLSLNMYLGLCIVPGEICLDGACRKDICGDGYCNTAKGETTSTCLQDCSVCGDGKCISARGETASSCSRDCPAQPPANLNFSIGNNIKVKAYTTNLAVRSSPSETATSLGSKNSGAKGNIIGGPKYEGVYWWYKIKWSDGLEGWSVANYLEKIEVFAIGDNVRIKKGVSGLGVLFGPSSGSAWFGTKKGYDIDSTSFGTIIDGPRADGDGGGFEFWKIIWVDGLEGWSAAKRSDSSGINYYLEKVTSIPVCESGKTASCGLKNVGECKIGSRACVSGQWRNCIGAVYPTAEICDGKDNDCDGFIDRKTCNLPGLQSPCYGYSSCVNGAWSSCDMVVEPVKEVCDNYMDNDCDGQIDEGLNCAVGSADVDSRWICQSQVTKSYRFVSGSSIELMNQASNYCVGNASSPTGSSCHMVGVCDGDTVCWHGECMKKEERVFGLKVLDINDITNNDLGLPYGGTALCADQPYYQWVIAFDTIDANINVDVNWGGGVSGTYTIKEGVWTPISHVFGAYSYDHLRGVGINDNKGYVKVTNSRGESKTVNLVWRAYNCPLPPSDSIFKKEERFECVETCGLSSDVSGEISAFPDVIKRVGIVPTGDFGTVESVWYDRWVFARFDNGLRGWIYPSKLAHDMSINITGPKSVAVNTTNKWSISAIDPWGGSLTYNVQWGETYTQGQWPGGHYTDAYTGDSGQKVEMSHNYLENHLLGFASGSLYFSDSRLLVYFPIVKITITNSKGEKVTRTMSVQLHEGKFKPGDKVLAGQLNRGVYQEFPASANNLKFTSSPIGVYSKPVDAVGIGGVPPKAKGTIMPDNDPVYSQPFGIWWKVDFENSTFVDGWVSQDAIWKI